MPAETRLQQLVERAHAMDMRRERSQEQVTRDVLLPSMPGLVDALERARRSVDDEMRARAAAAPMVASSDLAGASTLADYPVGFCRIIRDAVLERLRRDPSWQSVMRRGVEVRDVFVILKGRYFQNAMQVGNLYVDVANDTVDRSKHWLEWSPVGDVPFENAGDLSRLGSVAAAYLGCTVHPNTVFPLLSPVVPLLAVRGGGHVELLHVAPGCFLKDVGDGMRSYRAWIAGGMAGTSPLPVGALQALRAACGSNDLGGFPFEFRRCGAEELDGQALAYAEAAADPSKHELITAVLDLVPVAADRLVQRQRAQP
jgi:hypothetical protein